MTSDEAYAAVVDARRQFDGYLTTLLTLWAYLDAALRRYDAVCAAEKATAARDREMAQ